MPSRSVSPSVSQGAPSVLQSTETSSFQRSTGSSIQDTFSNTRVIALSMYGDLHYRQRMFAAGAAA
jgi:hypothetical protein